MFLHALRLPYHSPGSYIRILNLETIRYIRNEKKNCPARMIDRLFEDVTAYRQVEIMTQPRYNDLVTNGVVFLLESMPNDERSEERLRHQLKQNMGQRGYMEMSKIQNLCGVINVSRQICQAMSD